MGFRRHDGIAGSASGLGRFTSSLASALLLSASVSVAGCVSVPRPIESAGSADSARPARLANITVTEPSLPSHELFYAHHADADRSHYDIWRMCGDGSQIASLITAPGHQLQIAISANGQSIIYASKETGQWELLQRDIDSADTKNITNHPANDSEPGWSVNRRHVVFASDRDSKQKQLYLLDLQTSQTERLTNNAFYDSGATFSPDGKFIAFTRYFPTESGGSHDGDGEIFVLDLATGNEQQVTSLGGYNGGVRYSPDGRTLAFHRVADGGSEIWLMNVDGTSMHAITNTAIDEYSPEWSPDGQWLAIAAGTGNDSQGRFDLWLLRPDGTERVLLNAAANTQSWHSWRPGNHRCR